MKKGSKIAGTDYMPSWWPEAIAIEYLSCRTFKDAARIGTIDFSLVDKAELAKALIDKKIVSYGTLIQNVDPQTFQSRSIMGLISTVARPIVDRDSAAILPNGVVSRHHFPWLANPINSCDPIESFNSYVQILDDGELYQWEVARLEGVKGRNYARWVSDYVDLSEFDENYEEFQELMRSKSSTSLHLDTYEERAQTYLAKLRGMRAKAYVTLLTVHEDLKVKDIISRGKVVSYKPPALSHFETMKIDGGEISTTCFIAAIFFRAAIKHCAIAKKFFIDGNVTRPHLLDEIYEERAQAIIMGVACLEAAVNEAGNHRHPDMWKFLEKLTLGEKLNLIHRLASPAAAFDSSRHPFQFVLKMVISRNEMIHFKTEYKKCKVLDGVAVSRMETILNGELADALPLVLADSIKQIYLTVGLPEPEWLTDQPGWKLTAPSQQILN